MKYAARIVLLAMLLVALPLRGYAGMLTALCGTHHGGAGAAQEHVHGQGASHEHDSSDGGAESPLHTASVCSVCASCCAGAGLAAQAFQMGVMFQSPGTHRIPFLDRQVSGFVPDRLDRPPLAA